VDTILFTKTADVKGISDIKHWKESLIITEDCDLKLLLKDPGRKKTIQEKTAGRVLPVISFLLLSSDESAMTIECVFKENKTTTRNRQ
jgi:hypothetical protein